MRVLGIETSCDETAAAVLADGLLRSNVVESQDPIHARYGGVVPELASRRHLEVLLPVVARALDEAGVRLPELDGIAVTHGPGLVGSLLVGLSAAKAFAYAHGIPLVGVNHLEGHIFAGRLADPTLDAGFLALVVSGGHTALYACERPLTYRLVGQTRDDAAGEAFDKVAKLLGLPYPGGPHIDRLARTGNPDRFNFPRSMMHSGDFAFSFSGLKTAVRYLVADVGREAVADICASFQEAVVDVLLSKTLAAATIRGRRLIAVSGGVCCNSRLRERFESASAGRGFELLLADASLGTDNAAMIAFVAAEMWRRGAVSDLATDIDPNLRLTACAADER